MHGEENPCHNHTMYVFSYHLECIIVILEFSNALEDETCYGILNALLQPCRPHFEALYSFVLII